MLCKLLYLDLNTACYTYIVQLFTYPTEQGARVERACASGHHECALGGHALVDRLDHGVRRADGTGRQVAPSGVQLCVRRKLRARARLPRTRRWDPGAIGGNASIDVFEYLMNLQIQIWQLKQSKTKCLDTQ